MALARLGGQFLDPFAQIRWPKSLHAGQQCRRFVFDEDAGCVLHFDKAALAHVGDEIDQAVKKGPDVEQTHGFVVKGELQPGEGFEQFIQRAEASWEGDEAVAEVDHHLLSLVHAADDVQFGDAAITQFFFHERLRDDADDLPLLRQRAVSNRAHQADVSAAIDEADAALGQKGAEIMRSGTVAGVVAKGGTTIDTDSAQSGHGGMMNDFCRRCKGLRKREVLRYD